jgi:hypothetical protein
MTILMTMPPGQCNVHCPMERIHGFMQSGQMPPLGKCSCCIAPVVAIVINIGLTINTTHNYILASDYHTF